MDYERNGEQWEDDIYANGKPPRYIGLLLFIGVLLAALAVGLSVRGDEKPKPWNHEFDYATFPPMKGRQRVYVVRAVDGDSIQIYFCVPYKLRLARLQAPEKSQPEKWEKSKQALMSRLNVGGLQTVDLKGPYKYWGAVMGEVYDEEGGSVNQWLIDKGYARAWDGKGNREEIDKQP